MALGCYSGESQRILAELGYRLDEKSLQLRHLTTGSPFRFTDQEQYDKVGDALVDLLHELMVKEYGMQKVQLRDEQGEFVFLSSNAWSAEELIILACGAGKTAAGQWARKVCINDSLRTGSALDFIEWTHKSNIALLILNPNDETRKKINFSFESRTDHILRAWDAICRNLPAKKIAIVAHSCGGYDACELLKHRESELLGRLKCIAFTDAGQASYVKDLPIAARNFLVENGIEWVASNEPLGTLVRAEGRKTGTKSNWLCKGASSAVTVFHCMEVSAGTASHGKTTYVAFPAISDFILLKFSGEQTRRKAEQKATTCSGWLMRQIVQKNRPAHKSEGLAG